MNVLIRQFWSFFENQPGSKAYLREWSRHLPCMWQSGQLGDCYSSMSALQIAFTLCNGLYHYARWTGTQTPFTPFPDSPVNLLQGSDAWPANHNGEKSEWSCGPMSIALVGLGAAWSEPGREVCIRRAWSCHCVTNAVDNIVEVWEPQAGWVALVPHLNLYFMAGLKMLSLRDLAILDRTGDRNAYTPVTISGTGDPFPALAAS